MSTTEINEKAVENIAEVLSGVEGLTDKLEVKTSEFKTKLSEMGVDVEGDNLSTLIDKMKVMSLGKKWASGVVTSSSSRTNFKLFDGISNKDSYKAIVDGLKFTASTVLLLEEKTVLKDSRSLTVIVNGMIVMCLGANSTPQTGSGHIGPQDANFFIESTSFSAPTYYANKVYNWIALE